MEQHPIYDFARHYNPNLTDAEIKSKFIDGGKYLETLDRMRQETHPDLDQDAFLTKFHTKYPDLSKKKEPAVSGVSSGAGSSYSWDSGRPKLEGVVVGKQTSLTSASSGQASNVRVTQGQVDAAAKQAENTIAYQKAKERGNFEKAADLDDYTKQQVQGSILLPEKEYETRLNALQSDSGNLQRAIEATEARIKEKWGENWMADYNARQQALSNPETRTEELAKQQQEFEADQFINDRNKFITALEANHESGKQILKDDKYAYARALEEYDKKKLQKAEHAGWGNLTLGILQRTAGKFVGQFGELMNIGENLVTEDKKYGTWDKVEDFFIDFQAATDKVAPRPTKYTRPLYTKTAKANLGGQQVEVDFNGDRPGVVRDNKGMILDVDPNQFKDLKPKNQYNGKGLLYQTGEVLADAIVQIATTKGIGGTLVKTGMGTKAAYAIGVTASTMGQMSGQLYDKGLEMFNGDKRKAAQYAAMTGTAIGVGANLFGLEARLAGGKGLFDGMTQAARTLTPRMAAAQTATQWVKQVGKTGLGEAFEETILQKAIESVTAMTLNGDPEDIDLNEMKGTALISFAVGALMGGSSDFKNSAWIVASENPEEFKKALQAEVANGKNIDVEAMYNKALKIKGLSEITEIDESDVEKLDELTELQDKADKSKAIGAKEQAKVFEEQAATKEKELFKEKEEVAIPDDEVLFVDFMAIEEELAAAENLPAETTTGTPVQESVNQEVVSDPQAIENLPAETSAETPQEAVSQGAESSQEFPDVAPIEPKTIEQLGKENKSTYPKIPTERVFTNPVSQPVDRASVDEATDLPIESVKVSEIIPTQKNLTIDNLENTKDVQNPDEPIVLIKEDGKYYVKDGHHRIANAILDGNSEIEAQVYENAPTPSIVEQADWTKTSDTLTLADTLTDMEEDGARMKNEEGGNADQEKIYKELEARGVAPEDIPFLSRVSSTDPKGQVANALGIEEVTDEDFAEFDRRQKEVRAKYSKETPSSTTEAASSAAEERVINGKPNTQMAAQAFDGSTEGIIFKNGFFGLKLKESFIRGVKKLWNYTFYRDGNLPDIGSRVAQKRLGKIREQIKKADLSSDRLREMLKGKSEAQIRDVNAALQNPSLGKAPIQYSDGTNIEEAILNELVEMRMHVDSLSSMLITEGIAIGESAMTILGNLEFYLTQDLTVDFTQDWNRLNGYADAKLGRLDAKIEEAEGIEKIEFQIDKLRVQAKKIQFYTANIEKAVREEEDKLRVAGKLPGNQSPRRKDIGKAYETGVYKYSDGAQMEPGVIRDLKAMKELSKEIEKGIADLKLLGTLNMADMPMYLTRSYQVHWDKDWFDKVQNTEAFTNAVRFFREQKDKEKDDLIALVKFYREKLNSTSPGTGMVPSVSNDQAEAASEFYRAKLAKAELELSEIDMFDPVAEAKASLHQQADKSGSFSSSASLGSSSAGAFAKRKLIPDEIRALWGESKDPAINYMTSVYKIAHILENRRFTREVVKQGEGKFLHSFPVGEFFAKFPTSADELSEYYSTPEIVEAFKIYNQSITQSDPTNVFHRAIDALAYASSVVKKNLTVLSIASAARNFFYNPFAMIQRGAWNPLSKNVGKAIDYFRKGTEKETLEFYRFGILGDDLISGPLADIRKDYQRRTGEPVIPGPIGKSWLPRIKEELRKGTRAMEFAYAFGDNFYKVIDFYRQSEKLAKLYKNKLYDDLTVSEQEEIKQMAAERILSEHASYSTLPRGMRILAKQPLIAPFASHPYEMIRNTKNMFVNAIKDARDGSDFKENGLSVKQMELLKSMLGQMFVFGGIPLIGGLIRNVMSGMSDDDEEKLRYFLPRYHENSYIIPLNNDKGKVYYLDISGVLPQGHMLGTLNNLSDGRFGPVERAENALAKFMQPFTSVDPLTKSVAESYLGYQVDSPERKISIKGEEGWLKTRIWNIAGKKGPGTLNSLIRIHEAMTNPRTDLITSNEVMSLGLGIRVYNVDVVNNFGFAALEVADKLQDTFGEYDKLLTSKGFSLLSPKEQEAEKKKTIERETKDYYRFANEFRRVYLAAKTFPDIDQRAVDQKMARLGLDRYVVQGIMTGDIKEPRFGK